MAAAEGIDVDHVVVNDDVAVEDSTHTTGRRGIAGTAFVHKVAGARAQAGGTLHEVKQAAQTVIQNVRSMGVALTPCTLPEAGKPGFTLAGMKLRSASVFTVNRVWNGQRCERLPTVTTVLADKVLSDLPFQPGDRVAVMVNGMGATPLMELNVVGKELHAILKEKRIEVVDTWIGEFMTSLYMAGCSITLLKMTDDTEKWLSAPADTVAVRRY